VAEKMDQKRTRIAKVAISGDKSRARGIQSLETGLAVLYALAECEGPSALSVLAKKVGMPPSQMHRYLASLVVAGMVKQNADSGHYDLGPGAMRLGLAAFSRLDIFHEADRVFSALARETGNTSLLAIWGDRGPTIIRWYPGNPPIVTAFYLGSTLPLLKSAIGQVFFAFGHVPTMDKAAKRELSGAKTKLDLAELRESVIKSTGSSIDSVMIPGLRAVAAPIFDLQGTVILVAASIVLTAAVSKDSDRRMKTELHRSCRTVTEAIGGRWPMA
jgi:DNA-binding IclR family transcriptional regulator